MAHVAADSVVEWVNGNFIMWEIPLSDIDIGEDEIAAVTDVLRSKWLTMGEVTQRFEREFAAMVGVKHAFAVTNCTAALQLAYRALGVGPGHEFIIPSLTFVATANAGVVEGAVPVFADVQSEQDLTISPEDVERKITGRTKAVTVVHYAGHPCEMDSILEITRRLNIAVVEDCAHSPGATYRGTQTGAIGDIGCFSFFSNKNMTTGEGGMVTTNRDDLAGSIRLLRSHGMTTLTVERHKGHAFSYDVVDAGHNFRIDEIRSAIGLVQLGKLIERNARRKGLVEHYRKELKNIEGVIIPFENREGESAYHIMPVVLPATADREAVMTAMRNDGIQTSIHYPPIHHFSHYRTAFPADSRGLPVTEGVASRLLTLPLYPSMSEVDVPFVAASLKRSLPSESTRW